VKNINLVTLLFFLLVGINGVSYGNKLQVKLPLKAGKGEIHEIVSPEVVQYIQELLDSVEDTASHAEREELKLVIEEHLQELYHKSALLIRCEQTSTSKIIEQHGCLREKRLLKNEVANFKKQLGEYIDQVVSGRKKHYSLKDYLTVGTLIAGVVAVGAGLKKLWNNRNHTKVKKGDERSEQASPPGGNPAQNQRGIFFPFSSILHFPYLVSGSLAFFIDIPGSRNSTKAKTEDERIMMVYNAIKYRDAAAFVEALKSLLPSDDINKPVKEGLENLTLLSSVARYTDNVNMINLLVDRKAILYLTMGASVISPLLEALEHDHYEVAHHLIKLGAPTVNGCLFRFVRKIAISDKEKQELKKDLEMLRCMLENRANVNEIVTIEYVEETVLSSFIKYVLKQGLLNKENKRSYIFEILDEMIKHVSFDVKPNRLLVNITIQGGDEDLVDMLLKARAPIDEADKSGNTPIALALEEGNDVLVRKLIDMKPEILRVPIKWGLPPLAFFFSQRGNSRRDKESHEKNIIIVRYLLQKGADVNQIIEKDGHSGETVFRCCIDFVTFTNDFKFLAEMIEYVDFSLVPNKEAVYLVASKNHHELSAFLIDRLLKAGAPWDEPNEKDGNSPFQIAIKMGNLGVVKMLLEKGVNIYFKNNDGENAIRLAENYEKNKASALDDARNDILKELTGNLLGKRNQFEGPCDKPDESGYTPLQLATMNDNLGMVEKLLENGANICLKNEYEEDAIDIAISHSRKDILQVFANKFLQNGDNENHCKVVRALRKIQ
jgi:ankyrin repeat protein